MDELNPYESPKVEKPLKPAQVVKRGASVAAILVFTPLAVLIAFCANCTVVNVPYFPDSSPFWLTLPLPVGVFIVMMVWAISTHRRDKQR